MIDVIIKCESLIDDVSAFDIMAVISSATETFTYQQENNILR